MSILKFKFSGVPSRDWADIIERIVSFRKEGSDYILDIICYQFFCLKFLRYYEINTESGRSMEAINLCNRSKFGGIPLLSTINSSFTSSQIAIDFFEIIIPYA